MLLALKCERCQKGLGMNEYWMAPFVVAMRLPLLAREAQGLAKGRVPARLPESERMVTEKLVAAQEGLLLAGLEMARMNMEFGFLVVRGDAKGVEKLARDWPNRVAKAMSAPAGRRLRSNFRRLTLG